MCSSDDMLATGFRSFQQEAHEPSPHEIQAAITAAALELQDAFRRLELAQEDLSGTHFQFDMVEAAVMSNPSAEKVGKHRAASILRSVARSLRQTADRFDVVADPTRE